MKYQNFIYRCAKCQHSFKASGISGFLYGLFIMRSPETGEEVLLDAIEDPVYNEVSDILEIEFSTSEIDNFDSASVLQEIFGIACDPDSKENLFKIGGIPKCPQCGSDEVAFWEAPEPPEMVEKQIPSVTHNKWNALDHNQKVNLIREALLSLADRTKSITVARQ